MVFMTSPKVGILRAYPKLDEVRTLASYHNHYTIVQPGQPIAVTISDVTEPMMIGLNHPVRDVLDRDLATVLYLDGEGFYRVDELPDDARSSSPLERIG